MPATNLAHFDRGPAVQETDPLTIRRNTNLTDVDIRLHTALGIDAALLERQQVRRVTDREARELLALNGRHGDLSGVIFPYIWPGNTRAQTHRLRRDNPESEDGKPKGKYLSGHGDRRHLYFACDDPSVLTDVAIPVIVVEAEKSVLAVTSAAARKGRAVLAIGLGGCYGWRGRIGKVETPNGGTADEVGPLPDFDRIEWKSRDVIIAFDANAASNPMVRAARGKLAAQLRRREAVVRVLELPAGPGVNGPDDFIGLRGDAEFFGLVDAAKSEDFERTAKGMIIARSPHNIRLALARLNIAPTYDELAQQVRISGVPFDDYALGHLWIRINDGCGFQPPKEMLIDVINDLARQNATHPIREYLDRLQWDGTPRLDSWLITYAGAEDTPYVRAVGALPLLAAVRRVREPGAKFDELLILESSTHGTGKSSAIRALCARDEWFSDDLPLGVDSKQTIERTAGRWIIEAQELHGNRGREVEALKASLSRQEDGPVRLAYARLSVSVKRQFVIIGTTNSTLAYLKDMTGARRFWPVKVQRFDVDGLTRDRDQLWAEAATREAEGESIRLDQKLWQHAAAAQEARRAADPWEDVLEPLFENVDHVMDEGRQVEAVAVTKIWNRLGRLGDDVSYRNNLNADRVAAILQRYGFTRKKKIRVSSDETNLYWLRDTGTDARHEDE